MKKMSGSNCPVPGTGLSQGTGLFYVWPDRLVLGQAADQPVLPRCLISCWQDTLLAERHKTKLCKDPRGSRCCSIHCLGCSCCDKRNGRSSDCCSKNLRTVGLTCAQNNTPKKVWLLSNTV